MTEDVFGGCEDAGVFGLLGVAREGLGERVVVELEADFDNVERSYAESGECQYSSFALVCKGSL